jgi:hypothetical protein
MTEARSRTPTSRLQASHPSKREALISREQIETKCLDNWPDRTFIEEMHDHATNDDRSVDGANSAYSQETENEAIPCGQPSPPRVNVHREQTPPTQHDSEASTTQDNSQEDGAVPTRKRTFEEVTSTEWILEEVKNVIKKHHAAVAEQHNVKNFALRKENSRLRKAFSELLKRKRETEAQNARLLQENRELKQKMRTAADLQRQAAALMQD